MNQDSMSSQLAALNRNGSTEKPKPLFIVIFGLVCAVLIGAIIAVIVSAAARKNPAHIALDTVNHLLNVSEEPFTVTGTISFIPTAITPEAISDDEYFVGINLSFNAATTLLPTQIDADASISIAAHTESEEIPIEIPAHLSLIATETGKVYLDVSGLKTAIDGFIEPLGITSKYFEHFDEYKHIASLYGLISSLEKTWWELDLGTDYANFVSLLNTHAKNPALLQDAYAKNPFIIFTPAKDDQYLVGIDNAKYQAAFGHLPSASPDAVLTVDDQHRLKTLQSSTFVGDYALLANLSFDYDTPIDITAPTNYQPVELFIDDLLHALDY